MPLGHLGLHSLELLLEALAEDIDVVGRPVVDGPGEHAHEEGGRHPAVVEPERAGKHGQHRVRVLDQHEGGLLQGLGQVEDRLAEPILRVRLAQPGERGRAAGGDLVAAPDRDEEVVRELPDGIRDRGPGQHGDDVGVGGRGAGRRGLDGPDGGKALALLGWVEKMHNAVQCGARHDVDEERGDLVETVEDQGVAPHDNGYGVVAVGQAVDGCEEAL